MVTTLGWHVLIVVGQVINALSNVARCLEWKRLKIRLALVRAFLTTVQICCDIVSLLSIKMSRDSVLAAYHALSMGMT